MQEIQIYPIFIQSSPGVWDDFLHIRATAMAENYMCPLSATDIQHYRTEYLREWTHFKTNFAFAAYDNSRMVGFARGYCTHGYGMLRCLYVLPTYQGHGIGHRLLTCVENSVSPLCKYMDLVSLANAEHFYTNNGYHCTFPGSNTYQRQISPPRCSAVALFGASASMVKLCDSISCNSSVAPGLTAGRPSYGYFDERGIMTQYLIGTSNIAKPLLSRATPDFATKILLRNYNSYIQHQTQRGR